MATPEQVPPSMTVVLDQKKISELQVRGPKILIQAQELEIETADDYDASAGLLNFIATKQAEITNFFEKPAKDAFSVHKFITNLRSVLLSPWQQSETLIKNRRNKYRTDQETIRQKKEQEARELAKAEEDARALDEAKQLVDIGEPEAANLVIERAANAPPPPVIVPSVVPKQPGISVRKVWKYRIKNADLIKDEFWIPDESKIGAIVSKLGPDAASIVGGIEVFPDEIETIRRRG